MSDSTSTAPKRPKRQPTAADMIRSLAVLLVPVLIIVFFFARDPDNAPGTEEVEWLVVRDRAAAQAEFEVIAPDNLPDGWTPVRVEWEQGEQGRGQRWRVGWLSPQETYFALEQSNAPAQQFIADATRDGVQDGTSTLPEPGATPGASQDADEVPTRVWQRYRSSDDRTRALVWIGEDVTTIVVADAGYPELEAFAGTLA